ncbi:hypothetical protein MMC06_000266 [Schaereria dolodes]|nr:hypothetical protein [Schaereria dolodes]
MGLVVAAPTLEARTPTYVATQYDANFDDLSAVLPDITPIGTYKNLTFQAFSIPAAAQAKLVNNILTPPSQPTFGAFGLGDQVLAGNPGFAANSVTQFFDFSSMYFACSINTGGVFFGLSCRVQFTGTKVNGDTVLQDFTFTTQTTVPGSYEQIFFSDQFTNLTEVTMTIIESPTSPTLTVFLFDNLVFTGYSLA